MRLDGLSLTANRPTSPRKMERNFAMTFTLQQLDLEEIRQLKHRYFRCIDTGNEAELAQPAEDVTIDIAAAAIVVQVSGKADMIDFIASSSPPGRGRHASRPLA